MSDQRRERADATRNRRAILAATEDLLTRHRPEKITMEQIARAAGVGKGTVFHRFGSRGHLLMAVMQERAFALNESILSAPPPLGPGASAHERLYAFLDAVVEIVSRNKGLVAALGAALPSAGRSTTDTHCADLPDRATKSAEPSHAATGEARPVYDVWHSHISALIAEERADLDADLVAHVLLSSLHSDPILRLLENNEGHRLATALRAITTALLAMPAVPPSLA
ncbi:TetR/AcrR family transcriptional regulator [Frankia sp. AgKG'84/4]|uniref:TetR/AcrR family transcriptional regulator n=1 Tax=Frankia sp. AgKG'84/4 TaxID=573490 RepID=UPI00200F452F|nr:TetR/AcrR family transcriptional regulator [Frankia sp. AgKG'84/4]MCL9792751.1 TetR/AcrR family transcriptional regulator [Frankia sp. AgKG'84/4]